jgi:uncharacterized protein with HEPN domain
MPREWRHFVDDMLAAISMLEEAVEGKTLEAYRRDVVLRFATQRAVEIISEASRSLPEEAKNLGENIPWRKIGGIGNILRHEYFNVSDAVIWETITDDLPALKSA